MSIAPVVRERGKWFLDAHLFDIEVLVRVTHARAHARAHTHTDST